MRVVSPEPRRRRGERRHEPAPQHREIVVLAALHPMFPSTSAYTMFSLDIRRRAMAL